MQATQTEVKERSILFKGEMVRAIYKGEKTQTRRLAKGDTPCRFGQKGDRLWVRETFKEIENCYVYAADFAEPENWKPWKPSIFMPKYASRITLEIQEVKHERLQDISRENAIAEGCLNIEDFKALWISINGSISWTRNPWVWAIEFSVIKGAI